MSSTVARMLERPAVVLLAGIACSWVAAADGYGKDELAPLDAYLPDS